MTTERRASSPFTKVVPDHRHSFGVPRMHLHVKRKWAPKPERKWTPKEESATMRS